MKKRSSLELEEGKKATKKSRKAEPVSFGTSIIKFLKPDSTYSRLILSVAILICFSLSLGVRLNQFSVWKQTPAQYFVKDTPMMTTLDAYYWTKQSREYMEDTSKGLPDRLIVLLLSKLSPFFDHNVYKTGIFMIPVIASLFVIPFCIYFFRLGMPAGGIIGALVGTFSFIYMARSCIGRVRNDSMHLIFLFLASLFILLAGTGRDKKSVIIYSGLSGLTLWLFYWWYGNPVFTIVYLVTLALFLLINRLDKKIAAYGTLTFAVCSNPLVLWSLLKNLPYYFSYFYRYFSLTQADAPVSGSISFPNILQTITETQHTPLNEMLAMIISQPFFSQLGLILFFAVILLYWKAFVPLVPVLLLALMAFKSSNRFAMYLAPFIGVGLGYLIDILLNYFINRTGIAQKHNFFRDIAVYIVAFLFFFLISSKTGISYIPGASVPPDLYSTFEDIKTKIPEKSILFSWWDYGYAVKDLVGADVFHDGGAHGGQQTYLIARGLVIDKQKDLFGTIKCLDSVDGRCLSTVEKIIADNKTPEEMLKLVSGYSGQALHKNTYVLYTFDMIAKYSSIYFIGGWDFGSKSGQYLGYQEISCQELNAGILKCGNDGFDLNKGLLNGRPSIKRVVFVKNGSVAQDLVFPNKEGSILELFMNNSNQVFAVFGMNEALFNSNFNQMYLMGKFDGSLFEEVYNKFPLARMFRVKQKP